MHRHHYPRGTPPIAGVTTRKTIQPRKRSKEVETASNISLIFCCYIMPMARSRNNYHRHSNRSRRSPQKQNKKGYFAAQILGLSLFGGVATWHAAPQIQSLWSQVKKTPGEIAAIERSVYYGGCDEARSAGVAPIYRGQPGYREGMDGDLDGIACEPYRGR